MDPGSTRAEAEAKYMQSSYMLANLGLQKYHRNIKNGLLTDDTIMLWNESALTECRIPPGPRCVPVGSLAPMNLLRTLSMKQSRLCASKSLATMVKRACRADHVCACVHCSLRVFHAFTRFVSLTSQCICTLSKRSTLMQAAHSGSLGASAPRSQADEGAATQRVMVIK